MAKLYPPVIENTVSACYEENGMIKFTIPFSMNRAVSPTQVGGFELKIKTVQTGAVLYTIYTINPSNYKMDETKSYVIFYLKDTEKKLKISQFYKVQLAYIELADANKKDELYNNYTGGLINLEEYESQALQIGSVGYSSSIGVIKYTTKPKIYINNFSKNLLNTYTHTFMGYYDQTDGDISEKVYSYCFNIYDTNGTDILFTSGEHLHNSSSDTNMNISFDIFNLERDIQYYKVYYVTYTVTTINKMVISSPKYRIIQRETIDPEFYGNIIATNNFNEGYIEISAIPNYDYYVKRALEICVETKDYEWLNNIENIIKKGFNAEQASILYNNKNKLSTISNLKTSYPCTGSYVLARADKESGYSNWEIIYKFKLFNEIVENVIYRDYCIAQGKNYQYAIQQYNDNGLYSKRLYSNIINSDFEDAFLFDGYQQLKIRYNPKISKFTNTVLESKQETIGGQYPFIFRNGQVNYNEFTISGLISYLTDEAHLFLPPQDLITEERTTNYTADNVAQERLFKMKALEWLNNGKPKLFKSPTEGNFLVRLMKVSLSPEDKLGRMLHNFSCTAYEIGECNIETLQKVNILTIENESKSFLRFFSVDLRNKQPGVPINLINGNNIIVSSVKCENMQFGDELIITYQNGFQELIRIGITGNYNIEDSQNIQSVVIKPRFQKVLNPYTNDYSNYYVKNKNGQYEKASGGYDNSIEYYIISNSPLKGLITFSYIGEQPNNFSNIKNITYLNPIFQQFIGHHDILKAIKTIDGSTKDIKKSFVNWYYIKAYKRPIDRVIRQNDGEGNNIYYYGLDEYSERMMFSEIRYPIGLRAWEPGVYFVKDKNGNYINDNGKEFGVLKEDPVNKDKITGFVTYYLYGKYVQCQWPVGKIVYEKNKYYIYNTNSKEYELATEDFDKDQKYYTKHYDKKNIPYYEEMLYLTISNDYVFAPSKFYRKVDKIIPENQISETNPQHFTLANSFITDRELNKTYYYRLEPYTDEEKIELENAGKQDLMYKNAYVTINEKYIYRSQEYYMQVITSNNLIDENGNSTLPTKKYLLCTSGDFNIHNIPEKEFIDNVETFHEVEFGPFNNEVINYYKVKPILPELLHQIGTKENESSTIGWKELYSQDINGNNTVEGKNDIIHYYDFNPAVDENGNQLYIDFSEENPQEYANYEPWIKINGEIIDINDTMTFTISDLKGLNEITEFISGNGTVVEIGYQTQFIDYNIEDTTIASYRKTYDNAINILQERMNALVNPDDKNYINLDEEPTEENISIYNNYYYNTYQNNVNASYHSLVVRLNSELTL